MQEKPKTKQKMHLGQEALGGLSAGIVGTVIGYPLDLIKTRMQTAPPSSSSVVRPPNRMVGMAIYVVRNEGFSALYRGMGPPLLSLSILNTLNFTSYSYFRNLYSAQRGWDIKNALAGMTGAPLAGTISTVENFIKTQMQLDNINEKRFRGSFHCFTTLIKSHGTSIVYTGHIINTLREATFLATYFFTYEGIREYLIQTTATNNNNNNNGIVSSLAIPLAGGISGAVAWFVSFPLDCIRAGVQGQSIISSNKKRLNMEEVAMDLWRTKGFSGLYAGVTPSIARAFLVSGSRFSAYELALWLLKTNGW